MNKLPANKLRLVTLDILRFLSLLSVIAIHSFDTNIVLNYISHKLEAWAVPEFLLISFFITANKLHSRKFIVRRVYSLVIPYIIFSFLYLTIRFIKTVVLDNSPDYSLLSHLFTIFLFGGACGHLYYIPMYLLYFIIITSLIKIYNQHFFITKYNFFIIIYIAFLLIGFYLLFLLVLKLWPNLNDHYVTSFVHYFLSYLPYPPLGVLFFYLNNNSIVKRYLKKSWVIMLSIILIIFIYFYNLEYIFISRILLCMLIFVLALGLNDRCLNQKSIMIFTKLASLSMGVYFLHPLLIETSQILIFKLFAIELHSYIATLLTWIFAGIICSHLTVYFYHKLTHENQP